MYNAFISHGNNDNKIRDIKSYLSSPKYFIANNKIILHLLKPIYTSLKRFV